MNMDIKVDGTKVIANLEKMLPRVKAGLSVVGETTGAKMKAYAQNNAKWTDRTGQARGGLDYSSTWKGNILDISIMHTIDYGLWLEIRNFPHAGRLAILEDARDSQVQTFVNMVKKVIDG